MIKHLIFDFGDVFLDLNGRYTAVPEDLARVLNIPNEKAIEFWNEHHEGLMVGTDTPESFLIKMSNHFGIFIDVNETHKKWKKFNLMKKDRINWKLVDYVKSLKKSYKIHMLSNMIDLDESHVDWIAALHEEFDTIFKSFAIRHKKPHKESYLHVLEKINAKPEDCVFVDDLQKNIDGANAIGIKGILYTNLDQLKKDFTHLHIG